LCHNDCAFDAPCRRGSASVIRGAATRTLR
jgi:hypothetical protein